MKYNNNISNRFNNSVFLYFIIFLLSIYLSIIGESHFKKSDNYIYNLPKLNKKIIKIEILSALFFSEIRGVFVDLLWIYIESLWHQGRFYHLPKLYELITILQPKYIDAWVMGGWHMAYNMSHEVNETKNISNSIKKKIEYKWINAGIKFLKDGNIINPDNYEIMFEIAWTYFHRVKDYKNAKIWFKKASDSSPLNTISHRLYAKCLELDGKKVLAYKKWLDLKNHSSYNDSVSKKIIDKNIKRLEKFKIIKEYISHANSDT